MARPKKIPEAPQGATDAEGEGKAPMVAPKVGAAAEQNSAATDPAKTEALAAAQAELLRTAATQFEAEVAAKAVADAEAAAKVPARKKGVTVRVVAKQPSRWRIGQQFTAEPTLLQMDDLTEVELASLRSDPMLDVTAIEDI